MWFWLHFSFTSPSSLTELGLHNSSSSTESKSLFWSKLSELCWLVREDPNPGTLVHWASSLTCFKTTCFIRPSAHSQTSWNNAAAECSPHNSEPIAPLGQLTTQQTHSVLLCNFCSLIYSSLMSCHGSSSLHYILTTDRLQQFFVLNILNTHSFLPDTITSTRSGTGPHPTWDSLDLFHPVFAAVSCHNTSCFLWCSIDPWSRSLSLSSVSDTVLYSMSTCGRCRTSLPHVAM